MNHAESTELERLSCVVEKVRQHVEEGQKDHAVKLEALKAHVAGLNTMISIEFKHQSTINKNLTDLLERHDNDIRRIDRRLAYFAGGLALLVVLAQLTPHIIGIINGG